MRGLASRWAPVAVVLSLAVLTYALVVSAWQCDDAYITFRTVRNVSHGLGLTWNPGERVQAYTHPLWLALSLLAYTVAGELFYSMSVVSIALSVSAASGLAMLLASRPWLSAGAVLALAASRSFVDFGTSGLENPLLYVLLVLAAWLSHEESSPRRDLALTFVLSSVVLTRTDALLLLLPVWLWTVARNRNVRAAALGLLPVFAWELFSLVYYGSLVPNTAHAKLNLDLSTARLIEQGLSYLLDSLEHDPITLCLLLSACTLALWRGDGRARALSLGVLFYLAYVVRIGGDFMSGRFLSAPLVLALCAAALVLARESTRFSPLAFAPVALSLYALVFPQAPLRSGFSYGVGFPRESIVRPSGIADERAYYYPTTGLLRVLVADEDLRSQGVPIPPYKGALRGVAFAKSPEPVAVYNEVGFFGYFAGEKHIIDLWALCDPLLARIPYRAQEGFRVGHYPRPVPNGYVESQASGENRIVSPRLREAYNAIELVTRGPLWSKARFEAILALHTGRYAAAFAGAAAQPAP